MQELYAGLSDGFGQPPTYGRVAPYLLFWRDTAEAPKHGSKVMLLLLYEERRQHCEFSENFLALAEALEGLETYRRIGHGRYDHHHSVEHSIRETCTMKSGFGEAGVKRLSLVKADVNDEIRNAKGHRADRLRVWMQKSL